MILYNLRKYKNSKVCLCISKVPFLVFLNAIILQFVDIYKGGRECFLLELQFWLVYAKEVREYFSWSCELSLEIWVDVFRVRLRR